MRLDPEIAEAVAQTLGEPVPHPESDAFRKLLLRLDQENPALSGRLRSGLIFSQGGDLETQARRENRRETRRRGLSRFLFQRYDDLDNAWHPSKAKLLAFFSVFGLGGMGALFFGAPLLRGEAGPDAESVVGALLPETGVEQAVTPAQDADPFGRLPEEVTLDERARGALAGAVPLPAQSRGRSDAATPAEAEDGTAAAGEAVASDLEPAQTPAASPVAEGATETTLYEDPLLPSTEGEEERGLGVYTRSAESTPDPGLRVYGMAGTEGSPGAAGDPFAAPAGGSAAAPVGLAAYRRAEPEKSPPGDLAVYGTGAPTAGRLSVFRSARPAPTEARYVGRVSDASAAGPQAAVPPGGAIRSSPYAVGESLRATLQVGVVATPAAPLPVLARAIDGSVWQGTASLLPTGRVELRFTDVSVAGSSHPVSAVGQADDGFLGLPATVSEATPALASDLARGALRGLSEYVQALGAETEVRVEGNVPVISQSAPPLEANVAGSIARLFTPPEGEEQQALVRLAQVAAGTPVRVVVLAGAEANAAP